NIYVVRGKGELFSADQRYQVITNASIEDNFSYVLHGATCDFCLGGHIDTYLGFPSLYKVNNTTLRKSKVYQKVEVKRLGQNGWFQPSKELIGTVNLRLVGDQSEVLFNKKISVLPNDFSLSFESIDSVKGKICLKNSAPFAVSILGGNM